MSRRGAGLLAAAAALLVVLRLPGFWVPMDQDAGCYAYIGETWARGGLPYRDAWDHKPPAIFALTALVSLLTGGSSPVVLRALAVGLGVGTLLLVFGIVRRLANEAIGLAAAFVYALSSSGILVTRETFQTEHAMVFFSLLSVWLMVRAAERWRGWLVLLAGLAAGAAIAFKPVSAALSGLAFLWLLGRQRGTEGFGRRALQGVGLMAAGVLAVPVAFVAYFAAVGGLGEFSRAFISYNFLYRAAAEHAGVGQRTTLGMSHVTYSRLRELAPEQAWFLFLALGGLAATLRRGIPGSRSPASEGQAGELAGPGSGAPVGHRPSAIGNHLLILLWVVGAFVGVVAAGRFYAYYFLPMSAALAPLAAVGLVSGWRSLGGRPRPPLSEVASAVVVMLLLIGVAGLGLRQEWREFRALTGPQYSNAIMARLARTIREDTTPQDPIFVWGARQQVYVLAGRRAPCRYISDAHFRDPEAARAFFGQQVFQEIAEAVRAARCRYVLVTDTRALRTFPELAALLAADYETVKGETGDETMVTLLYRLRAAPVRKPT